MSFQAQSSSTGFFVSQLSGSSHQVFTPQQKFMNEKQNSFVRLSIASVHCFSIIYDALVVNLTGEGNLSLTTGETGKVKLDGPDRFNQIRTSSIAILTL